MTNLHVSNSCENVTRNDLYVKHLAQKKTILTSEAAKLRGAGSKCASVHTPIHVLKNSKRAPFFKL